MRRIAADAAWNGIRVRDLTIASMHDEILFEADKAIKNLEQGVADKKRTDPKYYRNLENIFKGAYDRKFSK